MRAGWILVILGGCGFSVPKATTGDDPIDAPAEPPPPDTPPGVFDVAHIDDSGLTGSIASIQISGNWTIDTGTLTITPAIGNVPFHVLPQPNGPDLAVLEVGSLASSGNLTITGTRPLLIAAATTIEIGGTIDASASAAGPGPGARIAGAGTGMIGTHVGTYADGGGGGGSFGTAGNTGGGATENSQVATGGPAGQPYGTASLDILEGGSPGGRGLPACPAQPIGGGGGGAVQLSAAVSIRIEGVIDAAGFGGQGGVTCPSNMSSAAGGGSGGAIYIQTPMLLGTGTLSANGGAGGSGSNWNGGPGQNGVLGEKGHRNAQVAAGGTAVLPDGAKGGNGGSQMAGAEAGSSVTSVYPNGGGGGGGAGRIRLEVPPSATISVVSSPPATRP